MKTKILKRKWGPIMLLWHFKLISVELNFTFILYFLLHARLYVCMYAYVYIHACMHTSTIYSSQSRNRSIQIELMCFN